VTVEITVNYGDSRLNALSSHTAKNPVLFGFALSGWGVLALSYRPSPLWAAAQSGVAFAACRKPPVTANIREHSGGRRPQRIWLKLTKMVAL